MASIQKFLIALDNSLAERFLQPDRINAFIERESSKVFQRVQRSGLECFPEIEREQVRRLCQTLPSLGNKMEASGFHVADEAQTDAREKDDRRGTLENERVLTKGVLQYPGAEVLLGMLESGERGSSLLETNMEVLLRHVEVKRQQALRRYSEPLTRTLRWRERCAYAALFCRYADLKKDGRFMNAALKLSEWLWKERRRSIPALPALPLLLALVEQERILQGLRSC